MPKLWTDTIEGHRREVRETVLDVVAQLVAEHGLRAVTMSEIAQRAGIGRATLYKYFSDVESILHAWHQRQVADHVDQLEKIRADGGEPGERLEAVLEAFALLAFHGGGDPGAEVVAALHRNEGVRQARRHVHDLLRSLLVEVAETGELRGDATPEELATYCIHALGAAADLRSKAAVRRLVAVTLTALRG